VLTYGIGPELAQIANGMTKLGWKVPMIGSWTLSMANFIDNAGKNGDGTRMPQTFIQDPTTPKRKAFIDALREKYKPPGGRMPRPVSAAQGYDSIYLLAAAIKQAGSTEGPKIKAALEDLKTPVEGVVTTYNKPYSKTDHEAINFEHPVFGEVKGGACVSPAPTKKKRRQLRARRRTDRAEEVRTGPEGQHGTRASRRRSQFSGRSMEPPCKSCPTHLQRHCARHDLRRHRVRLPTHLRHLRHPELRPGRRADAGRPGRPVAGGPSTAGHT
jgi:hypothetical protein